MLHYITYTPTSYPITSTCFWSFWSLGPFCRAIQTLEEGSAQAATCRRYLWHLAKPIQAHRLQPHGRHGRCYSYTAAIDSYYCNAGRDRNYDCATKHLLSSCPSLFLSFLSLLAPPTLLHSGRGLGHRLWRRLWRLSLVQMCGIVPGRNHE
jgi:hypothetical protein